MRFLVIFLALTSFLYSLTLQTSFISQYEKYKTLIFDLDGTITIKKENKIEQKIIQIIITLAQKEKTIVLSSGRIFSGIPIGKKDLKIHYEKIKNAIIKKNLNTSLLSKFFLSPQNEVFIINYKEFDDILNKNKTNINNFNDKDLLKYKLLKNNLHEEFQEKENLLLNIKQQKSIFEELKKRIDGIRNSEIGIKPIGFNLSIKLEPTENSALNLKKLKENIKNEISKILDENNLHNIEILEGLEVKMIVFMPGLKELDKSRIAKIFQKQGSVISFGDNGEKSGNNYLMLLNSETSIDVGGNNNTKAIYNIKNEVASLYIL